MFPPQLPAVPAVTASEVPALVEEGALLIDIREQDEWDEVRIPGAELKPMSQINDWWHRLPRDRKIILQCRTGSRSAHATQALTSQAGFDNVFNLSGGIMAWHAAGLPTER